MDFIKHQEYVLDYMFKVFPEQKGFVVAHSIGTGKTIIGIGFLMQYINTKYKFIVVIPHGLKHVWKNDCKKLGVEKLYNNIDFYTYEDFTNSKKNMKDKIIIFHEAHKISSFLEKSDNPEKYYNKIIKAYRILLLTGSPIYEDEIELRWLINIAAGSIILPIPKKEFSLKFQKLNMYNVFIFQWLVNYAKFSVTKSLAFDIIPGFLNSYYNILMSFIIIIEIYHPQSFYYTDTEKLMELSKKYITFFDPTDDNSLFPRVNLQYKYVSYTTSQLDIWSYLILRSTDKEIVKKLMPQFREDSYNFVGNKILGSADKWLDYGRIIGNITENGQVPIKFDEVLQTFIKGGMKRTVIYSNFWEKGCVLFGEYLYNKKIRYKYITPNLTETEIFVILEEFQAEIIPIIIIHPDMLGKIFINNTNQLHLLEPPLSFSTLDKLTGMVKRYKSHDKLPLKERNVDIYVWVASISNFIDKIKASITNLKNSFYLQPLVNYFYPKNGIYDFASDATPDYLIIKKHMVVKEVVESLKKHELRDPLVYKKECCLWRPNKNLIRECLQINNSMCIKSDIKKRRYY